MHYKIKTPSLETFHVSNTKMFHFYYILKTFYYEIGNRVPVSIGKMTESYIDKF